MSEGDFHQPNDKLFRTTFGVPENAAGIPKESLPREISASIDWSKLKSEPGSFLDSRFRASQTDLLFPVPFGNAEGWIYLLFGHQSSPDRLIHGREWPRIEIFEASGMKIPSPHLPRHSR